MNAGSSPIESIPLILSIACCQLRMTPVEALVAATANAAAALGRADRLGAIAVGHQADLLVLDVPNVERLACDVGRNPVRIVFKRGRIVYSAVADASPQA
jgi:imidazolonepropionase